MHLISYSIRYCHLLFIVFPPHPILPSLFDLLLEIWFITFSLQLLIWLSIEQCVYIITNFSLCMNKVGWIYLFIYCVFLIFHVYIYIYVCMCLCMGMFVCCILTDRLYSSFSLYFISFYAFLRCLHLPLSSCMHE